MAVTDLADAAAAVTAGYTKTQVDRGASPPALMAAAPRYLTVFAKTLALAGTVPCVFGASGESSVSAAAADTQAVASLNAARRHRYGGAPGRASGDANSPDAAGNVLSVDVS